MSKGTRLFVVVIIAVIFAGAIGTAIGLLRNQGVSVGGGLMEVLGGIIAGRVAAAMMKPKAVHESSQK